jgi:hypothetical protein
MILPNSNSPTRAEDVVLLLHHLQGFALLNHSKGKGLVCPLCQQNLFEKEKILL